MNAVTTTVGNDVAVTGMADSLLSVIERAARDPSVDIDKMERLIAMQERVQDRHAKIAYAEALADMQPHLPVITERGKILNGKQEVQSTYAYWEDVNEAIRPILHEHGFSLSFKTGRNGQSVCVTGILTHRMGHSEETTIELPSDSSGNKNAVQAVASSTSYGKRYTAFALLNITSKGEDDDGATATYKSTEGRPMQRAKLNGEHTSATALKKAIGEMLNEIRASTNEKRIDAILRLGKGTIAQAEKDYPLLLDGDTRIEEDRGLKGYVADHRKMLRNSEGTKLISEARQQAFGVESLGNWYTVNEDAINALGDADRDIFDKEHQAYEAELEKAAV